MATNNKKPEERVIPESIERAIIKKRLADLKAERNQLLQNINTTEKQIAGLNAHLEQLQHNASAYNGAIDVLEALLKVEAIEEKVVVEEPVD